MAESTGEDKNSEEPPVVWTRTTCFHRRRARPEVIYHILRKFKVPEDQVHLTVLDLKHEVFEAYEGRTEFMDKVRRHAKKRGLWSPRNFDYCAWGLIRVSSKTFEYMVLACVLMEERGRQMSLFERLTLSAPPGMSMTAFDTCTPLIAGDYFGYSVEVSKHFRLRTSLCDMNEPFPPLLRPCAILSQWPGILARCTSYGWYVNMHFRRKVLQPPMSWDDWCRIGNKGECTICLSPLDPQEGEGRSFCKACWRVARMDHCSHSPRLLNGLAAMLWETPDERREMNEFLQFRDVGYILPHRYNMSRTTAWSVIQHCLLHGMDEFHDAVQTLVDATQTHNIPLTTAQAYDIWGLMTTQAPDGSFDMEPDRVLTITSGIWRVEEAYCRQPRYHSRCILGAHKKPWIYKLDRAGGESWERHPNETLTYDVFRVLYLVGKTFAAWEMRRDIRPCGITAETHLTPVTLYKGAVFQVPLSTDRSVSPPVFQYRRVPRTYTYTEMVKMVQKYNAWAPWETEQPNNVIPDEDGDYKEATMDKDTDRRRKAFKDKDRASKKKKAKTKAKTGPTRRK